MSKHQTQQDVNKMLTGVEVQAAVDKVVAYILEHQEFLHSKEAAHAYWAALFDEEKLDILLKALKS